MGRLARLRVRADRPHLLATADGKPFFLLGDTAWELFHRLNETESERYFANRAAKGFNLICAVALAEFDGLRTQNAAGEVPLHDLDPRRPNEAYFSQVDRQIAQAEAHRLYVGLLPTWGDKLTAPWGDGPRIFHADDPETAREYGRWLGARYRDVTNLLWILGGDRPASLTGISRSWTHPWEAGFTDATDWRPLWAAMAAGISEGTRGEALFAYHPQGGSLSSSQFLQGEPWLNINMIQSGHGGGHDAPIWQLIERDYALLPPKPTLDAEPNYEDHPVNPWPTWNPANGYFRDYDVRKQCYRSVFAGGCGVIYGHHSVWQFWDGVREKVNYAEFLWADALDRPGAFHVGFLRRLMESRAIVGHVPSPSLLASDAGEGGSRIGAAMDPGGSYGFVYLPRANEPVTVRLDMLAGPRIRAAWWDPRTGREVEEIGVVAASGAETFVRADDGQGGAGPDWVLTLDSVE
jgi:hypothetical protein